jgi:superfamily II DNA or RNA helicase
MAHICIIPKMKAIVTNKLTVIKNATPEVEQRLSKMLSYRDKSKDFQLRRLGRNPANKRSSFYKNLEKEAYGSMLHRLNDGNLAMSSGFVDRLLSMGVDIEDRRKLTGKTIPLPWKKKPYDLRDYQDDAVEKMLDNNRGIINFATGLGKTLVAVHAIKKHRTKTLVTAPTESIAKQFYESLVEAFGDAKVGFYGAGKKKIKDITVGICASVNNNIDDFVKEDLGLIIMDEAHHTPASTFFNICWGLADVGKIFGLTATDYRSDGKDIMIEAACGGVLISRDINWGVSNKWLAKPKFIMKQVDTKHRKNFRDDKIKSYKEHVLNCDEMKQQILRDIQGDISNGLSVLVLVNEVAHGEELSRLLGVPFATGKDKKSNDYVKQLNEGKICALIGTDGKVGEGTDTTRVDSLVLANFVAAQGAVMQAVGRGLRKYGNKTECIVRDYWPTGSDMLARHALQRVKYYQDITDDVEIIEP